MKHFYIILIICFGFNSQAQNLKLLNGRVVSDLEDLVGIKIENVNQKYEKVTSNGGYFSLKVALNDTLVFRSEMFYDFKHVVTEEDFKTDLLHIKLVKLSGLLDEIEIYKSIDPVALGILQKPAKQLTVAERRLYSASSGPVDLLVNTLNGKRKSLKKLIAMQNLSDKESALINFIGKDDIIDDYNIPEDYIPAFAQYIYLDSAIKNAYKFQNKPLLKMLLIDLSAEFIKEWEIQ